MDLILDEHVKAVIEFMQQNIPANKLLGVSAGVHGISRELWGKHSQIGVCPLVLEPSPISEKQSTASV